MRENKLNPYKILNIRKNASASTIKAAYKKLAQKFHPDREGGDHARFQEIQAAYDLLSNAECRKQYDETGETAKGPSLRAQALSNLAQLFESTLKDIDLETAKHKDLIGVVRRNIDLIESEINKKLKNLNAVKNIYDEIAKRSKGKQNYLKGYAESKAANIEKNIQHITKELELVPIVRELLEGAAYECDDLQHVAFFSGAGTYTVTGE